MVIYGLADLRPVLTGPNCPSSHSSILPIMEWYTRYIFQMINKVQTDNIKAFEVKDKAVKDLYDHTHELMKRLAWSSRKSDPVRNAENAEAGINEGQRAVRGSRMAKFMAQSRQSIPAPDCTSSRC